MVQADKGKVVDYINGHRVYHIDYTMDVKSCEATFSSC